jgi:hypothetical protein
MNAGARRSRRGLWLWLWLWLWLAFVLAGVAGLRSMTQMPGSSQVGPLPPSSGEETELRERLQGHVAVLAGAIGERNLWRYEALQAAAAGCVQGGDQDRDFGIDKARDAPRHLGPGHQRLGGVDRLGRQVVIEQQAGVDPAGVGSGGGRLAPLGRTWVDGGRRNRYRPSNPPMIMMMSPLSVQRPRRWASRRARRLLRRSRVR